MMLLTFIFMLHSPLKMVKKINKKSQWDDANSFINIWSS